MISAEPGALLGAEVQGRLSLSQLHFLVRATLETAEKEPAVTWFSLHTASTPASAEDSGHHLPPQREPKVARTVLRLTKFGLCEPPSGADAEGAGKGQLLPTP